jgi:hypothetical protein
MPFMAKKKPPRGTGRTPRYILYARIDVALGEVLDRYVRDTKPRPSATSVTELALQEYFERLGLWPPPPDDETR